MTSPGFLLDKQPSKPDKVTREGEIYERGSPMDHLSLPQTWIRTSRNNDITPTVAISFRCDTYAMNSQATIRTRHSKGFKALI